MSKTFIVSIPDGQEVIAYLESYLARENIKEAAIVGCMGLLEELRIHYPITVARPPETKQETYSGPVAINGGSGTVHNGKVHMHASFRLKEASFGGHLEMGKVYYYCEIAVSTLD